MYLHQGSGCLDLTSECDFSRKTYLIVKAIISLIPEQLLCCLNNAKFMSHDSGFFKL